MKRVRFAPSPTGFVHVGNVRTALFNFLYSKKKNGRFVLRIEDTDVERSKREYEMNLINDLKWIGIEWDEGPDIGGNFGPYRQSERLGIYRKYAERLIAEDKAYYCFCSKEELEKQKGDAMKQGNSPVYIDKCRGLDIEESKIRIKKGEKAAVKFKIPRNIYIEFKDMIRGNVKFDSNLLIDPVIVRSSGIPAYNFSVVIDDFLMKINLVIRGEDHLSNTSRQVLIYKAFDIEPPEFAHLSMVMGPDNTKLSKRHGSTSILQFRENGYLPQALFNYLALLGWSSDNGKEILLKHELISAFDLNKVSKSSAIFDYKKLQWMNREHIRLMNDEDIGNVMTSFLEKRGIKFNHEIEIFKWIGQASKVLSNYKHLLTEISEGFKEFISVDYSKELIKKIKDSENSIKVISMFFKEISVLGSPIEFSKVAEILKKIQTQTKIKGKELYHPLRIALTGKESGIEFKEYIPIIERGSILNIEPRVKNMKYRLMAFLK